MIGVYLIATLVVILMDKTGQVIAGINTMINNDLSGVEVFWWGLLIAFLLDIVTGSNNSN